jgi:hypothetical protein
MFEDRKYHWCPMHNAWTMHTPAECKGTYYKKGSGNGNGNGNNNNNNNNASQPQALVSMTTGASKVPVKVNEAYHTLVQYCGVDDEDDF